MNWYKENPVITAIAAVALIGTIAATILAMQGATNRGEAVTNLNNQASTLRRLQSKQPHPNQANFQSLNETVNTYETAIQAFVQKLNAIEISIDEKITPQIFQDNLREAVNDLQKEAKKNQVNLPEKFFLGFEDYQTQLPTQDEVKKLHREFQLIKSLVGSIIPLGIQSIDFLDRHPAFVPPAPTRDPKTAPHKNEAPPADPIPFDSFSLGITASQASFVKAFDKILGSPGFLVVRSMTIQNTNPEPAPKAGPEQPATPASTAHSQKAASPDKLPIIFGSESIKATINLEAPDFPEKTSRTPTPQKK